MLKREIHPQEVIDKMTKRQNAEVARASLPQYICGVMALSQSLIRAFGVHFSAPDKVPFATKKY